MSGFFVRIDNEHWRDRAAEYVLKAPYGTKLEFSRPKRSNPQNDKMWAMLGEISTQKKWHGQHLDAESWKLLFMDALNSELRVVPNLNGNGFVPLGNSSSKLTKEQFADLLEIIHEWCARNGVVLHDVKAV